jgi:hypothetical protein
MADNALHKFKTQELLHKVLNSGEDALKVDLEGAEISATIDVRLQAANDSVTVEHAITGIANGRKVVSAAATAEAISGAQACKNVDITAETDNTGVIVVGGTTVVAAVGTRQGTPLNAGDSYSIDIDDLSDIFIDATVSGEGVSFTYFT